MKNKLFFGIAIISLFISSTALAQFGDWTDNADTFSRSKTTAVSDTFTEEDTVTISVSRVNLKTDSTRTMALAVEFNTEKRWHFYADNKPIPTGKLDLTARARGVTFAKPIFPARITYDDKILNEKYDIYKGAFTVYLPFTLDQAAETASENITATIDIDGAVCAEVCKFLKDARLTTIIKTDDDANIKDVTIEEPTAAEKSETATAPLTSLYTMPVAFSLAILAGLLLNVMPCVWPIIPIIITRLWNLSGKSRTKSAAMGFSFSFGILLFFAAIAAANIVLRLSYGVVFQWGDFYRNSAFIIAISLLMVVLGLFMFGLFNFSLPSSVSNKAGAGQGHTGSIGMGFLLALLSTPCGFGILAAAFAWAQTKPLPLATFTIMLIGVGMAIPYILLTSIPGLLNRLPKAGAWMERIKQMMGFLLLIIAVKLLSAIPAAARINTLYYAIILSFCVWMWGGWVTYATARSRKYLIRAIAVLIAVTFGWLLLSTPGEYKIDWLDYDAAEISQAVEDGKPVLIKFTADWCTTCVVVDRFVYSRKDIVELIEQKAVLAYKADTTLKDYPATIDLAVFYKEPAVPVSVIILPDGTREHLRGMFDRDELKKILEPLKDTGQINGKEKETESS